MSTIIMSECWPIQGMSPSQKAVLISLADQANDEGVCWPSIATIAARTCLSERAVQGAIKWLVDHKALLVKERTGRSTIYKITPAAFAPQQEMHPADAAPTPAGNAPPPPQMLHPTPADAAPRTVIEPSNGTVKEPSVVSPPPASTKKTNGTRLPEDWKLPKAWGEWALTERKDWTADDVRCAADRFKDHWLANANRCEGKKADWSATWRNWVRNERLQRNYRPASIPAEQAEEERRRQTTESAKRKLFGDQSVIEKEVVGETV